ncbi:hypothetical protein HDU76_000796 [Blyttiomyces sp. JEL0837]|nr:hypothetical protein HDU76_000796 [Blyttiomyces sp. JEL0837]
MGNNAPCTAPEVGASSKVQPTCTLCIKCTACIDGKVVNSGSSSGGAPASQSANPQTPTIATSAASGTRRPPPPVPDQALLHTLREDDEVASDDIRMAGQARALSPQAGLNSTTSSASPTSPGSLSSPLSTSLSSLSRTDGSRTAGKAARKKRPESVAAGSPSSPSVPIPTGGVSTSSLNSNTVAAATSSITGILSTPKPGVPDTNPAAWASPAVVAAISMSRIRGTSAEPVITTTSQVSGGFSEFEDGESDNGDGTVSAGARRAAAVRKRITMMGADDVEIGGVMLRGLPPPSAQSNSNSMTSQELLNLSGTVAHNRRRAHSDKPSASDDDLASIGSGSISNTSSKKGSGSMNALAEERLGSGSMGSGGLMGKSGSGSRMSKSQDLFGFPSSGKRKGSSGFPDGSFHSATTGPDGSGGPTITGSGGASGHSVPQQQGNMGGINTSGAYSSEVTRSSQMGSAAGLAGTGGGLNHPALNISGGVGVRKGKKGQSSMSLSSMLSSNTGMSHGSSNSESGTGRKGSKGVVDSSKFNSLGHLMEEDVLPDIVDLNTIFSTKGNAIGTLDRMIWSGRCYEICRQEWLQQGTPDLAEHDSVPNDEIKYRILENFSDGRLDAVTYDSRDGVTEFISAGPSEALVDALIFPLNQDNSYAEVFLATYRFFLPASEVLTSLIEWYNVEVDEQATSSEEAYFKKNRRHFRARAIKVLLTWVKNHWLDFHADPNLLEELSNFVADVSEVSFGDSQKMTQAIREQRLAWYMTQYIPPFSNKRAPLSEAIKPWGLLWEADAFAEQLTLIDCHLFRQVRPDTYLHILQAPVSKTTASQNVAFKVLMEYVSWFRLVSSYVATLIFKEDGNKKRSKAIKRFIKIAKICREFNNFNTTFAVIHGLRRSAITKLTQAWEGVASKYMEAFRDLERLMDPQDGYANYWTELQGHKTPLIPFFAAYMHDLLEVHEEEPLYISDLHNKDPDSTSLSRHSIDELNSNPSISPSTYNSHQNITNSPINFTKFYELFSIIAELEVWRGSSYRELLPEASLAAADPKIDTSAVVLNHMRDYALLEDRILDGDGSGGDAGGSPGKGAHGKKVSAWGGTA